MPGLGRKTWSPGDTLNAADVNGYLMDQSVMVFAGTAARASAIPTPSAGMVAYSTATSLQVYNGSAWTDLTTGYGSASGGSATSITVAGTAYTLLTFTTDSTLTVGKAGKFDIFAVGGGGGGGTLGGGGGGGGIMQATIELAATTYSVAIGVGGPGAPAANTAGYNGSPSGLASIAAGGGGGGSQQNTNGRNGGCGGGGGNRTSTGGSGFPLQGSNGGNGPGGVAVGGGGGGGASAVGANAVGAAGGNGGAGTSASTFTGGSVATVFSGGGGGGGTTPGNGTDGGGNGTDAGTAGSGTAGRGGGGGGANSGTAGAGSSGIVYVRFKT